jgi:hypothetical protein
LGEKRILRFLKRLDCHLMRDSGELPQEFIQRMAAFKIVDQVLERNSRATKAGRSVHDVRVNHYYGLCHAPLSNVTAESP